MPDFENLGASVSSANVEMRNPRICITGGHGLALTTALLIMAEKNIDVVTADIADAVVDIDWVLDSVPIEDDFNEADRMLIEAGRSVGKQGLNRMLVESGFRNYDGMPEPVACDDSYCDGVQHWRGGSRGKGGKIKYRRT